MTKILDKAFGTTYHIDFTDNFKNKFIDDYRFVGLAIGGSWIGGNIDEFSDLDFYLITNPNNKNLSFEDKKLLIEPLGELLNCYENTHDDRVMVCLYKKNSQLLHVDIKWTDENGFKDRVENPEILFERETILSNIMQQYPSAGYPKPDLQLHENRFWTWMHYVLSKIGRGELFEAYHYLCDVRNYCLGPMLLTLHHLPGRGMRRIELIDKKDLKLLSTGTPKEIADRYLLEATLNTIEHYILTRNKIINPEFNPAKKAEVACLEYAEYIQKKIMK